MFKKLGLIMLCLVFTSSFVMASPVNLPTGIKGQEGFGVEKDSGTMFGEEECQVIKDLRDNIGLSGGFLNDYVGERDLNKYSGKASFDMVGGIIDMSIMKRFDVYTMLGSTLNSNVKGSELGHTAELDLKDSFMWGVGADAIIYDWKDAGVQFFGDGNYRESSSMKLDSLTIDGTTVSSSQLAAAGVNSSAKWEEWQAALGVSKKFQYVIPYGGVVYSDVRTSDKVTYSGITYNSETLSSRYKVGPFVGVSILPTKWLSIDITGRFVAEEAVSAAVTLKF